MKILFTFIFIVSINVCFGQKMITEIKPSNNYKELKDIKTINAFIDRFNKSNDENLTKLIKNELKLKKLDTNNMKVATLKVSHIYKNIGSESVKNSIFINTPNEKTFKINNKDKDIYYHIDKRTFFKYQSVVSDTFIRNELKKINEEFKYSCSEKPIKAIHDSVFNKNMRVIKQAVILNSTDDATNNSAISITNKKDENKISVGFNFDYKESHFLNLTVFTEADGGFIYSKEAWKNNTGASFTWNRSFSGTQYFETNDCNKLSKKRNNYKQELSLYQNYLEKTYNSSKKKVDTLEASNTNMINKSPSLSFEKREEYLKNKKTLKELRSEIKTYELILKNPKKYLNDSIYSFDKKNDILYGGFVHWFKATGKIANQTINIPNDSIYSNKKITNYPSLNVDLSFNWNWILKGSKYINVQLFNSINMGSFLEANLGDEEPILVKEEDTFFIDDSFGNRLGRYQDLKKAFWTNSTGVQASWIFTKNVGITGIYKHTFALQDEENTTYKNRYTLQGGLILRPLKEDEKALTVRLLAGVENSAYKSKFKDDFSLKLSLGLPFNVFEKKDK